MDIGDAVTICLVLLALWTFIPRSFRSALRGGLEPTVVALARAVESATRAAAHVLIELAYRVLIGQVPPPRAERTTPKKDYVAPQLVREPVRLAPEPLEPLPVLPHLHQVELGEPAKNEPPEEPPTPTVNEHMNRAEIIALLAVQKKADGAYVYSSNQITAFVGGTAAEVKKQIAELRDQPKSTEPAPERGKSLRRPAEGW